jgi:cysteine desulfurase
MSTKPRIYLDFNATAPLIEPARAAVAAALSEVGNPSSIHAEGRRMRDLVERARNQAAALVGRPREQIVFTSGGTEANALGVLALAREVERLGKPLVVATTAIEHPSLRGAIAQLANRGWSVRTLTTATVDGRAEPVLATVETKHVEGRPSRVVAAMGPAALHGVGLLAVALVNHELGTTLPELMIPAARGAGALIHLDAVQAAGKRALDLDVDALAISAHKIGGPQGIGALAIAIDHALPLVDGGHQERGRRPGTENTLGIIGFGAAAAAVDAATWPAVAALGEQLERGLLALPDVRIHGAELPRIGGTVNAGFAGALGESIVIGLDLEGIAVSTGAACTSGSVQPSPVLLGLGMPPEQAREAVRFSLGRSTTEAEIERLLAILPGVLARARAHRA